MTGKSTLDGNCAFITHLSFLASFNVVDARYRRQIVIASHSTAHVRSLHLIHDRAEN